MGKPKVLIVDDEIEILEIFKHIFSKDYEVFTAKNAKEALKIVKKDYPQVVITDIKMPGMSGVELLKEVKEFSSSTEVIIMTGYASLETSIDALRWGAFDYLLKPFDTIDKVRSVINRALDKIRITSEAIDKRETLVRRAFELSSLYDISKAVSNFASYKDLMELILDSLYKMIRYDLGGGIFYLDSGEKFVFRKYSHLSENYLKEIKALAEEKYLEVSGMEIKANKIMTLVSGIEEENNKVEEYLWAPINIPDLPSGLFFLSSGQKNAFSEDEKKIFKSIIEHASGEINKMSSIFSSDQKKIQSFVDVLHNGVFMINKNYELVMFNPVAKEILSSISITLPKQWGKKRCGCILCERIESIFLGEKLVSDEIEVDGKHISFLAIPLLEEDSSIDGLVVVLNDQTREKQLKAQLIQVEKLSSVGQLISGVAHELNNPLTGVLGYAEMLMNSDIDGSIKDDLKKISLQAERCRKIIQNLLGFVRKHKPEMHPVNMNKILSSSLALREYELGVQNIKVIRELEENLPFIRGDGHRLQQVILNLIINAEQAMKTAGKGNAITVKTSSQDEMVTVIVSDNGPGISKDNVEKIFDPFFTTKESGEGTGLGLNISKGIIEEHRGTITVTSKKDEGTCFTIELPVHKVEPEMKEKEVKPEDLKIEDKSEKKILVVDDEMVILDIMTNVLKEFGYNVTAFSDGETALRKIEEDQNFDLIILDLKMPGLGGKELYLIVKEKFTPLADKIIFSTGDLINPYTQTFLEEIGNKYIEKPFLLSTFQQVVNEVLYKR